MNRIDRKFNELGRAKKKALILFLTAGDPGLSATEKLVPALERAGADLIELGVPFSDPLADGPVIQASSQRALKRGVTLKKILAAVRRIRRKSSVPLLLMTYLNPPAHMGIERFARAARDSGVDGVIIPDLPPDEGKDISRVFRKQGLDLVYLLAPTSTAARRKFITRASRGFVYFVSVTGVTGARRTLSAALLKQVASLRRSADRPVCVGFGVSTPAQAKAAARVSDGVIIGSALVNALASERRLGVEAFAKRFVGPFARALGKAS